VAEAIAQSKASSVDELPRRELAGQQRTVSQKGRRADRVHQREHLHPPLSRVTTRRRTPIGTYIHGGGKIGVMVETWPAAAESRTLEKCRKDVAMHIAAAEPRFLRREDVTEKDLDTEREIARDAAAKSGKPDNIVEKMVQGKMEKFYGEACLLEQPYIRDDKSTVTQYLKTRGKEAGCELVVTRFTRFKLGEGIEKKSDDFAAEVASYMK
jgi:elongation factor Ts